MKSIIFLFFFVLSLNQTFAQEDSIIPIQYQTEYEKHILTNTKSTNLERLLAFGENASASRTEKIANEINAFIQEINASKLMRLSEVKLMKELHHKVHERFLTSYKLISPFHEIFENGQYNCVSATALFAIVLDELKIPYNIQEMPNHVYIMAYPETLSISVEMTAKTDAYYIPNRKNISQSIDALFRLGLITKNDLSTQTEMDIYNRFYNYNGEISLTELCGIQYYNQAIEFADNDKIKDAYNAICKTEMMYNYRKTNLIKYGLLISILENSKFDSITDIKYLITYANKESNDDKYVQYNYGSFLFEQLNGKSNRPIVDSSFTLIDNYLEDSVLKNELKSFYYFSYSEYYQVKFNLKKQLENAELAHQLNPTNLQIQTNLAKGFVMYYTDKFDDDLSDELGFELLLKKFDEYKLKYPFLAQHNLFLSSYFIVYTELSNYYYREDDGLNGKKYFDSALQVYDSIEDKEIVNEANIGWLFAEAGAYLARKHRYNEALEVLNKGLVYAPSHERILARIEIVKSRMKKN